MADEYQWPSIRKQDYNAMMNFARPMVRKGDDWQKVQWELLNHFEFLTNSDDHEELTRQVIRECEDEIAEDEFRRDCESI
jgi:hypothetical protein